MPTFYTETEQAEQRREEFRRQTRLADMFGESLGIDETEPEVLSFDTLAERVAPRDNEHNTLLKDMG